MNIVQQKIQTFRITDRILDLLLLFLSARTAMVLERLYHGKSWDVLDSQSFHWAAMVLIFAIWLILIQIFEYEQIFRRTQFYTILKNVALISFIGVTTTVTIDFLLKADLFKRSTIFFFGFLSFFFLFIKRGVLKYFLSSIRQEGMDPKNITIIGSHKRAERLISLFTENKEYGIKIKSILDPNPLRVGAKVDGMQVTGDLSGFMAEIKDKKIDEVFFATDLNHIDNIHDIFEYLDRVGVSYHMMINESVQSYSDKYLDIEPRSASYYGIPMLSFDAVSANHLKIYTKIWLEKFIAFIMLILTLPILLLFAILIKSTSKGPVFFSQERVGLHGRRFSQYKLRSMVVDAETQKEKFAHLNEQSGPVFKIKNDPRLTKIGKFIRKFSIDELPQLFNILTGSMTLIGPRPPVPSEVEKYKDAHFRRLSMKPGITGLWQVSGRNSVKDFDEWVQLDLEYIDNWSFLLDFKIALRTVTTVLSGTGM
ncbi:MAG: sugar transferase [Candidatus Marinimicrobia bacterium]|nr:sugar transferase [Candidatus Neomarinimicrobiota bacterium]